MCMLAHHLHGTAYKLVSIVCVELFDKASIDAQHGSTSSTHVHMLRRVQKAIRCNMRLLLSFIVSENCASCYTARLVSTCTPVIHMYTCPYCYQLPGIP